MAEPTAGFSLNVLTINTHKGFTAFNRRFILPELRDAVRSVSADIVCLQEVMGASRGTSAAHRKLAGYDPLVNFSPTPCGATTPTGAIAVYPEGHHGNAVLSRFPIEYYENRDISVGNGGEARPAVLPHRAAAERDNYSRDFASISVYAPTNGRRS